MRQASFKALAPMVAAAVLVLAGCQGMTSKSPPIHLNPNMDQQNRFDPQEPNEFFADGRSSREPVEGTMPVPVGGAAPGSAVATAGDPAAVAAAAQAEATYRTGKSADGWSATLPETLALDRALLDRGRARFDIYCTPCHDSAGTGNGTVAQRAGTWKPPSLHDDRLRSLPIGQIYDVITSGVRTMPSYASQVPRDDRWAIAAYVRTLQRSRIATREQVPADVATQKGW